MKLKTKMSLILGMTILSITPVIQAKAIDVLTYGDIKCTETKEWKEYKKLSAKARKGTVPPIQCEEMKTKSSNIKTVGAPLISNASTVTKFDLRNVNGKSYVTPVKSQYKTDLDWAFATASSIESNYLINNGTELNISELQMGYSVSYKLGNGINQYGYIIRGGENFEPISLDAIDGNIFMSTNVIGNYLAQRRGVVTEKTSGLVLNDDNYKKITSSTTGKLSDVSLNEYNVNDVIYYLPKSGKCYANDFESLKAIKQMVASYGAVQSKIHFRVGMGDILKPLDESTNEKQKISYVYNPKDSLFTHAGTIIGWDDNCLASNFADSEGGIPEGNGAWIVKNTYGTEYYLGKDGDISYIKDDDHPTTVKIGDKGYYYVSYYDSAICNSIMAVNNVTPTLNTNNYSYTKSMVMPLDVQKKALLMSKYKKQKNDTEILESFNVYSLGADDNVKIYYGTTTDFSKATLVAEATTEFEGYKNIKTSKKIAVADEYYIFIDYSKKDSYEFPIGPIDTKSSISYFAPLADYDEKPKTGVSFYSLDNGKTWTDSIGDGVDMGKVYDITEPLEEPYTTLINFYAPISVFTTTKDYDLSISSSTDEPISAEKGGSVSVTLELKNVTGDITTKIYNSNKQDVTNKFKITKDNNKYTIAGIVGTTTAGTYTAEFTYKDAVATKTFKVISTAPSNVLVKKITIDGKTEVIAGGYLVLDAIVTPKDATNKVLTWTSSDKKVATVDEEGIVKAVNEGTATITAEATDGSKVKGTLKIKVLGKKVEQTNNNPKEDENNTKEDTKKSPETGLTSITTALLITVLISVIAYVVFKKKNLFKRV